MPRFGIEPTVILCRTRIQLCKERLDRIGVEHGVVEECEALVALTSLDNKVIYAREDNVPEPVRDSRPLSCYNAGFNISGDEADGNWVIGFLLAFEVQGKDGGEAGGSDASVTTAGGRGGEEVLDEFNLVDFRKEFPNQTDRFGITIGRDLASPSADQGGEVDG